MNQSRKIIKHYSVLKEICRHYGTAREKTHYEVLGILKSASKQDIRLAYLKLSKEKHPDKNIEGNQYSHADFVKINEAYNVLSKSHLKEAYDDKLKYGNNSSIIYRRSSYNGSDDYHMYDTYHNVTMNVNRKNNFNGMPNSQQKVSKIQLVLFCLALWLFGTFFHLWVVIKSPLLNKQYRLDQSRKFSEVEEKVRLRAHENQLIYKNNAEIALALYKELNNDDD